MPDRREEILTRINAVLSGIEGVVLVQRNSVDVPESKVPALVLLDGDENPLDEGSFGKGRGPNTPILMQMFPEIYILMIEDPADVGTSMNAMRSKVVDAITNDAQLAALSHNGDIRYGGMQTALALGRSMTGEAGLGFSFVYACYPGRLTGA
jgi:hypothetical protein